MKSNGNRISATVAVTGGMLALACVFATSPAQAAPAGSHTVQLKQQTVQLGLSTVQLKQQTVQLGLSTVQLKTVQLGQHKTVQLSTVQLGQRTVQLRMSTVQLG
jgi:hypothetical protein